MDLRTARIRTIAAAVAVTSAGVIGLAIPAAALIPNMLASPTTLPAGGTVKSSASCAGTTVTVSLYAGWVDFETPPTGALITSSTGVIGTTGDWTDDLVVPTDTAPGTYALTGHCAGNDNNYDYSNMKITVLAAGAASTTSSQAPTTTALATTTTVPAAAKPAAAVPAKPTYTG